MKVPRGIRELNPVMQLHTSRGMGLSRCDPGNDKVIPV
jgi:hypothetical protein